MIFKNCLTISLYFKYRNKKAVIKASLPYLSQFKSLKLLLLYTRVYRREKGFFGWMLLPHFYVVYNNYKIQFFKTGIKRELI